MSSAAFMRLLEMNVDTDGQIGPLLDPISFPNRTLRNFEEIVPQTVIDAECLTPYLGKICQRSGLPHPVRTYDAARLYLLEATGGGSKRKERQGFEWMQENKAEAADLLIKSIVVEITGRVVTLHKWAKWKSRSKLRLFNKI